MCNRRRIVCLLQAAALLYGSSAHVWAQNAPAGSKTQNKYALLIGIDTYQPAGTTTHPPAGVKAAGRFATGLEFANLEGPTHDVDTMRKLLTGERFGFPQKNIDVLLDGAATHDAILARLKKDLVDDRKSGDTVVFYISSHGSLRVNSKSDAQAYDLDGTGQNPTPLDSTIVPADAYLGAEDVLSSELRHIFNMAADKGVKLTAIFDTCHSGGQARGAIDKKMVARNVEYDPRDLALSPPTDVAPADRKDNRVLVLSAAQKDQSAMDVQDAHPHGLFTAALAQAVEALPPGAPAMDVYRRVLVDMETGGAQNQQPALDATSERKHEPLFGGERVKGPARAMVVNTDGGIVLDVGPAADVGVGSEFTAINISNDGAAGGTKTVLRVTDALSLARSHAVVVAPAKAEVRAKELYELTKWMPAPRPEVKFYAGPGNLSLAQIQAAAGVVNDVKLALVNDPSIDAWTHVVTWNGSAWTLQAKKPQAAGKLDAKKAPAVVMLGTTLTTDALKKNVPANAMVWFNPPLPSEMTASMLTDKQSAAQLSAKPDDALYVAAGVQNAKGLSYAWYQRGDYEADVQTPAGYGAGCSPNSPYPLRTDWVPMTQAPDGPTPASQLNDAAVKLAKLNGWLKLQSTVTGSQDFPYALALVRASDKKAAADGEKTFAGDRYSLALNGSVDAVTEPRWVYVLDIDCQGTGQKLWPQGGPGGRFPTDNGRLASIPLPGLTFRITPPYGTDTYLLLTTSTPLPDPDVLNFEGVARGGTRGVSSPLADLLQTTSSGSRGASAEAPTDWSLQMVQTHSQPTAATKP